MEIERYIKAKKQYCFEGDLFGSRSVTFVTYKIHIWSGYFL